MAHLRDRCSIIVILMLGHSSLNHWLSVELIKRRKSTMLILPIVFLYRISICSYSRYRRIFPRFAMNCLQIYSVLSIQLIFLIIQHILRYVVISYWFNTVIGVLPWQNITKCYLLLSRVSIYIQIHIFCVLLQIFEITVLFESKIILISNLSTLAGTSVLIVLLGLILCVFGHGSRCRSCVWWVPWRLHQVFRNPNCLIRRDGIHIF